MMSANQECFETSLQRKVKILTICAYLCIKYDWEGKMILHQLNNHNVVAELSRASTFVDSRFVQSGRSRIRIQAREAGQKSNSVWYLLSWLKTMVAVELCSKIMVVHSLGIWSPSSLVPLKMGCKLLYVVLYMWIIKATWCHQIIFWSNGTHQY